MLQAAEEAKRSGKSVPELLASQFHSQYPHISHASRYDDTVQGIASLTQSFTRVRQLDGSPLHLKWVWSPMIRNKQGTLAVACRKTNLSGHYLDFACSSCTGCAPNFPAELQKRGLTEDLLKAALLQCSQARELPVDVRWLLKETSNVGSYMEMHNFLRK